MTDKGSVAEALKDALDGLEEMGSYLKGGYFWEKWDLGGYITRARAAIPLAVAMERENAELEQENTAYRQAMEAAKRTLPLLDELTKRRNAESGAVGRMGLSENLRVVPDDVRIAEKLRTALDSLEEETKR